MDYAKHGDTYIVRFDTDEEIVAGITQFLVDNRIDTGSLSGIGSAHHVVLGYYNRASKQYERRSFDDDMEIVSLVGNVSLKDGQPFAHLHVTLSGRDFQSISGHLFEGSVAATCEVVVRGLPGLATRRHDEKTGLFLLKP